MNSYYYIGENDKEIMKKKKFETKLLIQNLNKKNFFFNNNKNIDINKYSINQNSFSKYSIYSTNKKSNYNSNPTNYSTYNNKLPYLNNSSYTLINKDSRNYSQNANKTDYNITPFFEKDLNNEDKYIAIKLKKKEKKYLKNFNFIKKPTLLTLTLKTFVEKHKNNIISKKTFEHLDKLMPLSLNNNRFYNRNFDKRRISFVAPFNKKLFNNYLTETLNYADELKDKVDVLLNEKHELYTFLRITLINDINNTNNKDNKRLFNNIENLYNYKYDICIFPQLKNNLLFKNYNYNDDKITSQKICDNNCLSKEICHSLNKTRMNKFLGINDNAYKLNYQEIIKENKNINELNMEKYTEKFNLEDFFEKKYQKNNLIKFANKKEKACIIKLNSFKNNISY